MRNFEMSDPSLMLHFLLHPKYRNKHLYFPIWITDLKFLFMQLLSVAHKLLLFCKSIAEDGKRRTHIIRDFVCFFGQQNLKAARGLKC